MEPRNSQNDPLLREARVALRRAEEARCNANFAVARAADILAASRQLRASLSVTAPECGTVRKRGGLPRTGGVTGSPGYLKQVMSVADARSLAERHLGPLGRRWTHTLAVAECAEMAARVLPDNERAVVVAAALVHDLGCADGITDTGFHHLDGARYLRELGEHRLAALVAYHSAGRWEAEVRGLTLELGEFQEERSLTADVLAFADLRTGPGGTAMGLAERIEEVEARYGPDHPVARSLRLAEPDLTSRIAGVELRLSKSS